MSTGETFDRGSFGNCPEKQQLEGEDPFLTDRDSAQLLSFNINSDCKVDRGKDRDTTIDLKLGSLAFYDSSATPETKNDDMLCRSNPEPNRKGEVAVDVAEKSSEEQEAFEKYTPRRKLDEKEVEKVKNLIRLLGSTDYAVRTNSQSELTQFALGAGPADRRDVLPLIREATMSKDLEVARRARQIETRIYGATWQEVPPQVIDQFEHFSKDYLSDKRIHPNQDKLTPELDKRYQEYIAEADRLGRLMHPNELQSKVDYWGNKVFSEPNVMVAPAGMADLGLALMGIWASQAVEHGWRLKLDFGPAKYPVAYRTACAIFWLQEGPGRSRVEYAEALAKSGRNKEGVKYLTQALEKYPQIARTEPFLTAAAKLDALNNAKFAEKFKDSDGDKSLVDLCKIALSK